MLFGGIAFIKRRDPEIFGLLRYCFAQYVRRDKGIVRIFLNKAILRDEVRGRW